MTVREDQTRRVTGESGTYGVVEKPDFALVVPWDGERFHLIEQFRYPISRRCWKFPQGSWPTPGNLDDPYDLARAELREETDAQQASASAPTSAFRSARPRHSRLRAGTHLRARWPGFGWCGEPDELQPQPPCADRTENPSRFTFGTPTHLG